MDIRPENLFVDDLDGEWTLGLDMGDYFGTMTLCTFTDEQDTWLYPEDIGFNYIINIWSNEYNEWEFNVYKVPDDWKNLVTLNKGLDGKPSIHDLMVEVR